MEIKTRTAICFSPTKTTKEVVEKIAHGTKYHKKDTLDLTLPESVTQSYEFGRNELAVIGVPVYGGRVPLAAYERLLLLMGNHTPAVIVVVYGNREYEHALHELRQIVIQQGFIPVGGATFIGEHSFSSEEFPIAMGRPDQSDLNLASELGWKIKRKLDKMDSLDRINVLSVPGGPPYRDYMNSIPVAPISDAQVCTMCGTCADQCPMGGIIMNGVMKTNIEDCIFCFACIKGCPTGARMEESPQTLQIQEWLYKNHHDRKEPEIFL